MKQPRVLTLNDALLAIAVLIAVSGCASAQAQRQPAEDANTSYLSVWAELFPDTLTTRQAPGTLAGDFYAAADARTLAQARELWTGFLARHDPADGFYEDAMHARLCEWARMEMQRLTYLVSGDNEAASRQVEKMRHMAQE